MTKLLHCVFETPVTRLLTMVGILAAAACSRSDEPLHETANPLTAVPVPSVAIHVSETTRERWQYEPAWKSWHASRMLQEALVAEGTPFTYLSDADIASGRLRAADGAPAYPILFSLANEWTTDAVVDRVLDYVKTGGHAFVGSSSLTRRSDGSLTPRVATAMGLSGRGWSVTSQVAVDPARAAIEGADLHPLAANFFEHNPDGGPIDWKLPWNFDGARYDSVDSGNETGHWTLRATIDPTAVPQATPIAFRHTGPSRSLADPSRGLLSMQQQVGASPENWTVRFGDVNGDGADDLVGLDANAGQFFIMPSTGQGFGAPWTTSRPAGVVSVPALAPTPAGQTPDPFFIVDLDGDKKADLVQYARSRNLVYVSRGNGAGFDAPALWAVMLGTYDLAIGDIDGDQIKDFVARGEDGDIQVLRGMNGPKANLPFTRAGSVPQSVAGAPRGELFAADVDGDSCADIVARPGGTEAVYVARSTCDGTFGSPTLATGWANRSDVAVELSVADVDGDGRADLAGLQHPGHSIWVATGTETGAFLPPRCGITLRLRSRQPQLTSSGVRSPI